MCRAGRRLVATNTHLRALTKRAVSISLREAPVRVLGCRHEASVPSKRRIGCIVTTAIQPANRSDQRFSEGRGGMRPGSAFSGDFQPAPQVWVSASLTFCHPLPKPVSGAAVCSISPRMRCRTAVLVARRHGMHCSATFLGCHAGPDRGAGQFGEGLPALPVSATVTRTKVQRSGRMSMTPHLWPRNPENSQSRLRCPTWRWDPAGQPLGDADVFLVAAENRVYPAMAL